MWITDQEDELEVKDYIKNICGVEIKGFDSIESANEEIEMVVRDDREINLVVIFS